MGSIDKRGLLEFKSSSRDHNLSIENLKKSVVNLRNLYESGWPCKHYIEFYAYCFRAAGVSEAEIQTLMGDMMGGKKDAN